MDVEQSILGGSQRFYSGLTHNVGMTRIQDYTQIVVIQFIDHTQGYRNGLNKVCLS